MINAPDNCQVLVVQNGARHDYAVPLALAKASALAGFYTDACGNQGIGRVAAACAGLPFAPLPLSLLKNRRVPQSVLPLTRSFPIAAALNHFFSQGENLSDSNRLLGLLMNLAGDCGANLIYSSMGWSPRFLEAARKRGLPVVTEFYVRPSLWRVHQEEHLKFPGWEASLPYPQLTTSHAARRGPCDLSDYLIAPTLAVKKDLVQEGLFAAEKIHVVPYGISETFFQIQNKPVPGNVLFVGSCTIIKGIHYFAKAAQLATSEAKTATLRFTAAGEVSEMVRKQPACAPIKFLGRVPRQKINKLYLDADILVFPTLSDSFGMVILEAMAAGVPVISSPYCANIVEDGVSGFVIDPRDHKALASAITAITQDRGLRERMSLAALARARQFMWENHAEILLKTLHTIHLECQ